MGGLKQFGYVCLVMTLVSDVILDLVFVATYGGYEVPACPQRTLGEFLGFLFQPTGGFALQYLNDIRG